MFNKTTILTLILTAFFWSNALISQHNQDNLDYCHTDEMVDKLKNHDPEAYSKYIESRKGLEEFTVEFIKNNYNKDERSDNYIIPTVFHIVHTNGVENISNAQVFDAMRIMNEDFNKLNEDWVNSHEEFVDIVGDAGVEFRLAQKDPNGDCHTGITRTYSESTHDGGWGNSQLSDIQNEHGNWPGNMYMNIIVVANAGGAAGYTTLPNWNTNMSNGIYILHNYVGSIGTGNATRSRALTHEVGHWLNLLHPWGGSNTPGEPDNCDIDDGVADTPNTIGWTTCNVNGESCGSLDNVQNFMEYSYCSTMYTEGQVARMVAALNSTTGGRSNLWSQSNLEATGTGGDDISCMTFNADRRVVCEGREVSFSTSLHGLTSMTDFEWTMIGANPVTSNDNNPVVTYEEPGIYSVTLEPLAGGDPLVLEDYIVVLPSPGEASYLIEDFESVNDVVESNNVFVSGDSYGMDTWEITLDVGFESDKSIYLDNFNLNAGERHEFITNTVDVSGEDAAVLSFDLSYARRSTDNQDELRIYFSNNCGNSWVSGSQLQYTAQGVPNDLNTANIETGEFVPQNNNQWENILINIPSSFLVSDFKVKFEFRTGGGNNVYIDNINITNPDVLSTDDIKSVSDIRVFPNPANNQINFDFDNVKVDNITIYDMTGRIVESVGVNSSMTQVNVSSYESGIYIYQLKDNSGNIIKTDKISVLK